MAVWVIATVNTSGLYGKEENRVLDKFEKRESDWIQKKKKEKYLQ